MALKNVFIISGNEEYDNLFLLNNWAITLSIDDADLIVFTGGSDVSSHLYNSLSHPKTFCDISRDRFEKTIFERCISDKKPMVGICRGGQFLNVMNGGAMWQHVTNHTCSHTIIDTATGLEVYVTSTHHQMMRPNNDATVIAIAHQKGIKEEVDKNNAIITHLPKSDQPDVEVVLYKNTKSLCFQPHPEYYGHNSDGMRKYFFDLISQLLELK
jgi:gamma-glutamyl-gamma-aminobutyrate hydrolase PuuD